MALRVLSAMDTARTQYYHFKAIVIAGMGLFTDAYDLFCIPPVMKLIARVYYNSASAPPAIVSALVAVALLGTVLGQLSFGFLGDCVGRRRVYGFALLAMVFGAFGCGFSICKTRGCVLASLGFFRFLLGVGIGGDYPLSATIMSEFANKRTRGAFIAAVFSMQGLGILASSAVTMAVCSVFDGFTSRDSRPVVEMDLAWRLILMLGAVPAALTFYWRMMMPETARYTALVERNVMQAAKDMEKVLDVSMPPISEDSQYPPPPPPSFQTNPSPAPCPSSYPLLSSQFVARHGRHLFACAAAWFLVDIAFYSSNLFQSQIYKCYLPNPNNSSAFSEAFAVAKLQAIVAACSTIPGYWVAVFFIDRLGRVRVQIVGFLMMAVLYFVIGATYYAYWDHDPNVGFMFLYGLTFFFSNMGPNTTTFIVPAELFPARFRTTCHGISGAAGKVGAIIGSVGFLWASHGKKRREEEEKGYPKGIGMMASLLILGGICVMGVVVTYLFTPETMARSLEENESEYDDENKDQLSLLTCFAKNTDSTTAVHSHSSPNNA